MIPLFLLSLLFFVRFTDNVRETMVRNYSQINGYFARNVEDIMQSADEAMSAMYDYETDQGESLATVLKDSSIDDGKRAVEVVNALKDVMSKSKHIASTRFVDTNGQIYSVYYDQEKTLRNDAASYTQMKIVPEDRLRDLKVLRTTEESQICTNSDDFIFVLVRNYMDTTSVNRTYNTPLGTLFADINVDILDDLTDKIGLEKGSLYVCNPKEEHYVYSLDRKDYTDGRNPLGTKVMSKLTGEEGYEEIDGNLIFYARILDTDEYAVLKVNDAEAMGYYFSNRTMMAVILLFSCIFLVILYIVFSNRMSAPIRKVQDAMKQVENGQMDVRLQINSHDEMEIIADGFNKMVERLNDYINQVYVARICQKDAQLFIPKLLLQPVVENAIRHGLREKNGEGTVAIHVERKEDHLEIVVMDDGVGMDAEQVKIMQETLDDPEIGKVDADGRLSVGMKNVYDRIKLNCGKEYGFKIESFLHVGTIVTYRLPIWEEPGYVENSNR